MTSRRPSIPPFETERGQALVEFAFVALLLIGATPVRIFLAAGVLGAVLGMPRRVPERTVE